MTITKRTRYEVLRRDDHTCRYCGGRAPDVVLTVDHVNPTALGGSDDPSNLVAACKDCNAGKAASNPNATLVAQVADDAIRWATAMRAAVEDWALARAPGEEYSTAIAETLDSYNDIYRNGRAYFPDDWIDTVERWHILGLPVELVTDAIGIAMRKRAVRNGDVWRYTCGVVWSQLTEIQERAAAQLPSATGATHVDDEQFQRGWAAAEEHARRRFSNFQFQALCAVTDAEAMAWAAER